MQPWLFPPVFLSEGLKLEVDYINIHQEIVDRCKSGDKVACKELYDLYSKAMFNVCFRITNDRYEAEDVLQEAFVSAFKNIGAFRSESSFGAWLKKIVVNRSINHMKKKKVDTAPLEENMDKAEANYREEALDDPDKRVRNVEMIKKAVNLLPHGYRMVLSLYLLEGYDHAEIAQIMKISESTSKSQYNRAKKKLKIILEELCRTN